MRSTTPVCIVGAGPGGAATALRLSYLGIPCVLIDRATFPRDKVCGDAISGKVTTLLNRLDPAIMRRFTAESVQTDVWGIRFFAPNGQQLDIPFQANYVRDPDAAPGYVARRLDFDDFLIREVRRRDNIELYEGIAITGYERTTTGYRVSDAEGKLTVETPLLVLANGAHSTFSRKEAGLEKDPHHHAGAVRAYYRNVMGISPDNFIELHFLQSFTPGYFWIFPLPNGLTNVGLGMRSDILSRRGVNLRRSLDRIIREEPGIRERFAEAEPVSKVHGYSLPLGSKTRPLSGDHYLLVGDAGHLVDPLTGEGIGNAFYSGFIAAELAEKCIESNDYSAAFLRAYDLRVQRVLGSEMKLSYRLQQMLMYPAVVNVIARIIAGNQKVIDVLSNMYTDFSVREQLAKPLFWLKMLVKR